MSKFPIPPENIDLLSHGIPSIRQNQEWIEIPSQLFVLKCEQTLQTTKYVAPL